MSRKNKIGYIFILITFSFISFSTIALADEEREAAIEKLVRNLNAAIREGKLDAPTLKILYQRYRTAGRTDTAFELYIAATEKLKDKDTKDIKVTVEKHNGDDTLVYERGGETVKVLDIPKGFHMGIVKGTEDKAIKLIAYSVLSIVEKIASEDIRVAKIGTLHKAAEIGNGRAAELLIAKGADVNSVYDRMKTPLHIAAREGHVQIVKLLISKGANVNFMDYKSGWGGASPLHLAVQNGHTQVIELLIDRGAKVDIESKGSKTPMDIAATNGQTEVAKLLIAKGADVSKKNSKGWAPLHYAAKAGKTEVAKLLIAKGADVNRRGFNDYTPLHKAAENGHIKVAKLLITKGADVNAMSKGGDTPLHSAAENGKAEVAKLLIDNGADINARRNKFDYTPLHYAARNGYTEVAKVLVSKGADVSKSDIVIAENGGHAELGNFLRKHGGLSKREDLKQLIKELVQYSTEKFGGKRERAIRLAQQLSPPPVIPEEARRFMAEGIASMKVTRSIAGYEEAEGKFQKAANLAPWWADTYFNLAMAQEKQRNFFYAIKNLELYLLASPGTPEASAVQQKIYEIEYLMKRKEQADKHVDRGADLYNAGDIHGAVREGKEAIRLDPDNGLAHANLGAAYGALNRHKEAIPELKEAIRLGRRNAYIYSSLGRAYHNLGERKKAIDIMEEGVSEDGLGYSGRGLLHQKLGRYCKEEGEYEKALTNFEKALSYSSDKYVDKKWVHEMIKTLKRRLGR